MKTFMKVLMNSALLMGLMTLIQFKTEAYQPHSVVVYDRHDGWGGWEKPKKSCMDTRTNVLISSSTVDVVFTTNGCNVIRGRWRDEYSVDKTYMIASEIDIDHLVPIKWAFDHGAKNWDSDYKKQFYNDLANLMVTSASLNRSKGDKGPDKWLPPNDRFRCNYVKRFDSVVRRYELNYTEQEYKYVRKFLTNCTVSGRLSGVNNTSRYMLLTEYN